MTDAQKAAYMKQGDRQQRVDAFRNSQQTKDAIKSQDDVATVLQTNPEIHNMLGRWREFYAQIEKEEQEVAKQIAAIDDRYATQVAAVPRSVYYSAEEGGYFHNEAERKQVNAIIIKCRTEQYTLLRNHTIKVQERIKAVMATEVPRYDDLMKRHLTATGMTTAAPLTPSSGYDFAIRYLEAASNVLRVEDHDLHRKIDRSKRTN